MLSAAKRVILCVTHNAVKRQVVAKLLLESWMVVRWVARVRWGAARARARAVPLARAAGQGPAELAAAPPSPPTAEQTEQQPRVLAAQGGLGRCKPMITFISVPHLRPRHLHPMPPMDSGRATLAAQLAAGCDACCPITPASPAQANNQMQAPKLAAGVNK